MDTQPFCCVQPVCCLELEASSIVLVNISLLYTIAYLIWQFCIARGLCTVYGQRVLHLAFATPRRTIRVAGPSGLLDMQAPKILNSKVMVPDEARELPVRHPRLVRKPSASVGEFGNAHCRMSIFRFARCLNFSLWVLILYTYF